MNSSNVDLCESTSAPDLAGMARCRESSNAARQHEATIEVVRFGEGVVAIFTCICGRSHRDGPRSDGSFYCERCGHIVPLFPTANQNPPDSKPAAQVAGGGGADLTGQQQRPSPLGDDILRRADEVLAESDEIIAHARGDSGKPNTFFSCKCGQIERAEPSNDRCPECHQPLCMEWNASPREPQVCDPHVWLDRFTDLTLRNIASLRALINMHRHELDLDKVVAALNQIDEASRSIHLAGLRNTPLVAGRNGLALEGT